MPLLVVLRISSQPDVPQRLVAGHLAGVPGPCVAAAQAVVGAVLPGPVWVAGQYFKHLELQQGPPGAVYQVHENEHGLKAHACLQGRVP